MSEEQKFQAKMQEYMMLREELLEEIKAQESIINICLATVTAVLAFAFSQQISLILLAAYPIIYFLLEMYKRHRTGVMRISGYMIVFLEPYIHFNWEILGNIMYSEHNNSGRKVFWKSPHYHFWGALAIMAMLSAFIIDWTNGGALTILDVVEYVVHLLAIIVIYVNSFQLSQANDIRTKMVAYWRGAKQNIENGTYCDNTFHK